MVIYLGADHRGFELKESLKQFLMDGGYEVIDLGNDHYDEADDYPDFASLVGEKVSADSEQGRGILICGSGAGVTFSVNKFPRVRAALAISSDQIYDARKHDDINVLTLAANFVDGEEAGKIVKVFLETGFTGEERHRRRINKVIDLEERLRGV
ncbi:MAG: RpiB/LacA/LacB family sugar-phosphate isomerase [Candidatus Paceibacterota bacterium]|jgi:ribose 5-phosphate isomerase B